VPTMVLTDKTVKTIRATSGVVTIHDAHPKAAGLLLRVWPSGERRWSVRYRVGRSHRRLTLGDAAVIPLGGKQGAREMARAAMRAVVNGHDPAVERRERREADSVAQFADTYLARHAQVHKKSWKNDRQILKADVVPAWRTRLMRDITRRDVRELLQAILDRGAGIHANRVRACLSKLFAFAVTEDVVETNPVRDIPKPSPERIRRRVLDPEEIRLFWRHTETMAPKLRTLWRLRLLTAQRPQEEVAQMQWGEVNLDEPAWWTIPSEKSKNRLAHRVPLSTLAVQLLQEIRPTQPKVSDFVFAGITRDPSVRTGRAFPLPDFQPRDLRKSVRTRLAEDHVPEEWLERMLGHRKPGLIEVYNLHEYDAEKRQALDHWARRLDAIIRDAPGANVLPFARLA
jgi:integrase